MLGMITDVSAVLCKTSKSTVKCTEESPGRIRFMGRVGEGSTRWAFACQVLHVSQSDWDLGEDIVLKTVKPSEAKKGFKILPIEVEAQILAWRYAKIFNEQCPLARSSNLCTVHVLRPVLARLTRNLDLAGAKAGDHVILEERIRGKFQKFNCNTGWSAGVGLVPDFFSHWTWVTSQGKHLTCDLQGHRGVLGGPRYKGSECYYLFTDPVVLSDRAGQFGPCDLGLKGQETWFSHHVCNALCRDFGIDHCKPEVAPYTGRLLTWNDI